MQQLASQLPKRHYVKKVSFEPTPVLCYLLGVLLGDGSAYFYPYLDKRDGKLYLRYKAQLIVSEQVFAESFASALRELGLRSRARRETDGYWEAHASSKLLVLWYKSLTIEQIEKMVTLNRENMIAFLRGFYESEGSCYFDTKAQRCYASINNTNHQVILLTKKIMEHLGFHPRKHESNAGKKWLPEYHYYKIALYKKSEVKKFIELLNPCIKKGCFEKEKTTTVRRGRANKYSVETRLIVNTLLQTNIPKKAVAYIMNIPIETIKCWVKN